MEFDFEGMFADFFSAGADKAAKREVKKEVKKEVKNTKEIKPTGDGEVTLPVTVKARGFKSVIEGSGMMKLSALYEKLAEDYPQFLIPKFGLMHVSGISTVFVTEDMIASNKKDAVFSGDEAESVTVRICDGQRVCEVTVEDFEGKEADEICVGDLIDKWVLVNSDYEGCNMYYDEECHIAYPLFADTAFKSDGGDSVDVCVNGELNSVEVGESKNGMELGAKIAGDLGGGSASVYFGKKGAFLCYKKGKAKVFTKSGDATVAPAKQVEDKYPLPMTLYCVTWNCRYELSSEMFEGKQKVTKDQITKKMSEVDRIFADKSRKVEYLYNKEKNMMSCMFISGKKGIR